MALIIPCHLIIQSASHGETRQPTPTNLTHYTRRRLSHPAFVPPSPYLPLPASLFTCSSLLHVVIRSASDGIIHKVLFIAQYFYLFLTSTFRFLSNLTSRCPFLVPFPSDITLATASFPSFLYPHKKSIFRSLLPLISAAYFPSLFTCS